MKKIINALDFFVCLMEVVTIIDYRQNNGNIRVGVLAENVQVEKPQYENSVSNKCEIHEAWVENGNIVKAVRLITEFC